MVVTNSDFGLDTHPWSLRNKSVKQTGDTDEGTICYVIMVSDYLLHYEPLKNKITDLPIRPLLFYRACSIKYAVKQSVVLNKR